GCPRHRSPSWILSLAGRLLRTLVPTPVYLPTGSPNGQPMGAGPLAPRVRAETARRMLGPDVDRRSAATGGRPGGSRGAIRAGGPPHAPRDVFGRLPAHPKCPRRRGSGPGDLPSRLPRLPPVPAGHEPEGLAVPHPHQHVHQFLQEEAAP